MYSSQLALKFPVHPMIETPTMPAPWAHAEPGSIFGTHAILELQAFTARLELGGCNAQLLNLHRKCIFTSVWPFSFACLNLVHKGTSPHSSALSRCNMHAIPIATNCVNSLNIMLAAENSYLSILSQQPCERCTSPRFLIFFWFLFIYATWNTKNIGILELNS